MIASIFFARILDVLAPLPARTDGANQIQGVPLGRQYSGFQGLAVAA